MAKKDSTVASVLAFETKMVVSDKGFIVYALATLLRWEWQPACLKSALQLPLQAVCTL